MVKPLSVVDARASNGIQKMNVQPKHIPLDREKPKRPMDGGKTVWIAGALIVIVLVALGFLAAQKLFPGNPTVIPDSNSTDQNAFGLVKGLIVYSNDCKVCEKTSLLLLAFDNAGYDYKADLVETSTPKGQSLVLEYGLKTVPTLLLEVDSLTALPPNISTELKSNYRVQGNYLVIPELDFMNLTKKNLANVMFLQSPNPSCTVSSSAAKIDSFMDLVDCPNCASGFPRIQNIQQDLGNELNFEFHYTLFHGKSSENAAIATACAGQQQKLGDFASCAFKLDHNYSFLDRNASQHCAEQSNVQNLVSFNQCIDQNKTIALVGFNGTDHQLANAYSIYKIPTYVIDCRVMLAADGFVIRSNGSKYFPQLKEEICRQRPDLGTCKQLYPGAP